MRTFEIMGVVGVHTRLTSTDTAQSLPAGLLLDTTLNLKIKAATFMFETNHIRVAIGATPTQAGIGFLMEEGDSIRITGYANLANLKYISAANGVAGYIQVMPEY
jgi:hypothetical protein